MKVAVIVNTFGPSQLALCVGLCLNKLVEDGVAALGLYEDSEAACFGAKFPISHVYEGFGFNGAVVATSLNSAAKLLNFTGTRQKFFYVWDLEWVHMKTKNFKDLYAIYGNESLHLIARCEEHAKIIGKAWNRDVSVINDFDPTALLGVIKNAT